MITRMSNQVGSKASTDKTYIEKASNADIAQDYIHFDYVDQEELPPKKKNNGRHANRRKRKRAERSLELVTNNFIDLIVSNEEGKLDLTKAANSLQIHKRRIYDITNTLEGLGLIKKVGKNFVRWIGEGEKEQQQAQNEIERMEKEIQMLNDMIVRDFINNQEAEPFLFISQEKIVETVQKEQQSGHLSTFMFVSTPKDTLLNVEKTNNEAQPIRFLMVAPRNGKIQAQKLSEMGKLEDLGCRNKHSPRDKTQF